MLCPLPAAPPFAFAGAASGRGRRRQGGAALVRREQHVAHRLLRRARQHGTQLELVGAFVIDDQVGLQRQYLFAHDVDVVGRGDALAAGIQHLEPDVELVVGGPQVEPVADELRERIREEMTADGGRGADEGDAYCLGLALKRHRRSAKAVGVGGEPDRRRGVGQEAVRRAVFAGPAGILRRVIDEEVARRAAQIGVPAGIAHERRVPRLEHVGPPRAFGDAAFLHVAHQFAPCLGHLLAVGKRRRCLEEPGPLDPGRQRDFVEMPGGRPDLPILVQPTHQKLGGHGGQGDGDNDQKDVQPAFLHGRVSTGFIDS